MSETMNKTPRQSDNLCERMKGFFNADSRNNQTDTAQKKKSRPTHAQQVISLAMGRCELWHSQDRKAYATWEVAGHKENWRIRSPHFRQWLANTFYDATGEVCGKEAIGNALDVLEVKALKGHYFPVYLRVANTGDKLFIDLGNYAWQSVEITASGWKTINDAPVKFVRSSNTGILPMPASQGNIDLLQDLAATTPDTWLLVKGFILDALKGYSPYLVLSVSGIQGSAKSSLLRLLRRLIDPLKKAPLSKPPRDIDALRVDCENEYLLAYDNMSYLSQDISDSLCCVSTGGGFKGRLLYSDNEQNIVDAARPIAINGIPQCVESPDLLNRCLLVEQEAIPPDKRKDEKELNRKFDDIDPAVFAGILDLLVKGIANIGDIKLDKMPRMADSVKWITACLGNEAFLTRYEANENEANEVGLDASPIARTIIALAVSSKAGQWAGTIAELSQVLNDRVGYDERGKDFPATCKALGRRLKRDTPMLERAGIRITRERNMRERIVTITSTIGHKTSNADFADTILADISSLPES